MRTWIVITLLLLTCSQADAFGRRTRYRSTTRTNYSAPANYYECNDQGKCEIEAAYMHAHNINGHVFGVIGHFEGCGWDGVNTCQPPPGYYLTGEARVGNKIVRSWRVSS